MWLWKWIRWLIGYTEFEIYGVYGEQFVTLCMKEEIELWDLRRVCPGIIRVKTFSFSVPKLDAFARKCGVSLEHFHKVGLPQILSRHRLRTGFFAGICVYLGLLLLFSNIVWAVEIPGADPMQTAVVQEILLKNGFGVGSFAPSVDFRGLKHQLMLESDNISFASVNMQGCRALVDVRFSQQAPNRVDDHTPCNIVASRDGQIVSILVKDGVRYVKKGATVEKGDLLVGGVFDTRLGYYVVHAKAQILARVTEQSSETVYLEQIEAQRTGKTYTKRVWNFYGTVMNSAEKEIPFSDYETETTVCHLSLGNQTVLPVTLTKTVYYETTPVTVTLTFEEALSQARTLLDEKDRIRFCGKTVESTEESITESAGFVTLTRTRSLIEDIAEEKEFYFEDEG